MLPEESLPTRVALAVRGGQRLMAMAAGQVPDVTKDVRAIA